MDAYPIQKDFTFLVSLVPQGFSRPNDKTNYDFLPSLLYRQPTKTVVKQITAFCNTATELLFRSYPVRCLKSIIPPVSIPDKQNNNQNKFHTLEMVAIITE